MANMPTQIIYDKLGNKIPSREFLSMMIILLRKCEMEVGMSLVEWLEKLEQTGTNLSIDLYDDQSLRSAIHKLLDDAYPDKPKPLNPDDWVDDDEDELLLEPLQQETAHHSVTDATPEGFDDDEEPLPPIMKLEE